MGAALSHITECVKLTPKRHRLGPSRNRYATSTRAVQAIARPSFFSGRSHELLLRLALQNVGRRLFASTVPIPMETLFLALALAGTFQFFKHRDQQRRIRLLGSHLSRHRIEALMETLLDGYLRALGEVTPERRAQVWQTLEGAETALRDQLQQLATGFAEVWGDDALVSTLPVALPRAHKLFPRATFDLRRALAIHAEGIARGVHNTAGRSPRDKAFMLTAEVLLLQHTCHWFCRSRTVADARMRARHQTDHAQLIAAISPETREAYMKLIGR